MTQPEPQSRYAWPSGGIADFIVGVLLEAVSIFLFAVTLWAIGHWLPPLAGWTNPIQYAIFTACAFRALVPYRFALTSEGALDVLKATVILCAVLLIISGAAEFVSTNIIK